MGEKEYSVDAEFVEAYAQFMKDENLLHDCGSVDVENLMDLMRDHWTSMKQACESMAKELEMKKLH